MNISVSHAPRFLVIQVARIGDTLLVTPAIRALKSAYPRGYLGVLAHPQRRELLENLPFIDKLGSITSKTAWWRGRFNGNRWDYALVYGQDAPLIRYAARVSKRVIAFQQHETDSNQRLWRAVTASREPTHAVRERLLLIEALGVTAQDTSLAIAVSRAEQTGAEHWLTANLPTGAGPVVGFQVASFPTKSYRDWPLDFFVELGRRLQNTYRHSHVLVLGGPESRDKAAWLTRQLDRATSVAGRLTLRELTALLAKMNLYVGVDTGPTHIAGALRIPMVAMYHCRHRGKYLAPLQHDQLRIIEHPANDESCSPSSQMSEISVEEVWENVQALLSR